MISDKLIWWQHQFYKLAIGTLIPVHRLAPVAPRADELRVPEGRLKLQIVSHCWQYSHMLRFQISSLIKYTPSNIDITYTLFYSPEDTGVKKLIAHYDALNIDGIQWDWQPLPTPSLFRRAIGRHKAAKTTNADWVWFSDCDLIFHEHCLDSLAAELSSKQTGLVFPDKERITDLLPPEHPMLDQNGEAIVDIDTSLFSHNAITKAKGAFQIVHGDVARAAGYCGSLKLYSTPTEHWRKTYEDSIFRQLIQYEGEPVSVEGLHRVRHMEKGRYKKDSALSDIRGRIRLATDEQETSK